MFVSGGLPAGVAAVDGEGDAGDHADAIDGEGDDRGGDAGCEARIKADTKATIRCIPFDRAAEAGACVVCGRPSPGRVIVARAY